jgi:hypothetical protein
MVCGHVRDETLKTLWNNKKKRRDNPQDAKCRTASRTTTKPSISLLSIGPSDHPISWPPILAPLFECGTTRRTRAHSSGNTRALYTNIPAGIHPDYEAAFALTGTSTGARLAIICTRSITWCAAPVAQSHAGHRPTRHTRGSAGCIATDEDGL